MAHAELHLFTIMVQSTHRRFAGKSRGHALCLNPQPNPQNLLSCPTSAYLGSPRGLVSRCKTYRGSAVTAEVAGSSPVVLTTHSKGFSSVWQVTFKGTIKVH